MLNKRRVLLRVAHFASKKGPAIIDNTNSKQQYIFSQQL